MFLVQQHTMEIKIADIIKSDLALFHQEGLDVYEFLKSAFDNQKSFELSFAGITRCSTQFLNASVGKLYLDYDYALVDSLISYDYAGLTILKDKIAEVRDNAINSADYNSYVESALN